MIEAYTWKYEDHRENHLSRRQVSSVKRMNAVGDDVTISESKTKDALWRVSGGTVGVRSRGTHIEIYQELERPSLFLACEVGEGNARSPSDDILEVRLAHSTPRRESRPHGEGASGYAKSSKETLSDGKNRL